VEGEFSEVHTHSPKIIKKSPFRGCMNLVVGVCYLTN
jgi:hypothetical protein